MITRFFLDVGLLSSAERAIEVASFSASLTSSAGIATGASLVLQQQLQLLQLSE